MEQPTLNPPGIRRLAIEVRGVVQGVGFRPFVYSAARGRRLAGWVRNEADAVRIEVQGRADALEQFLETLRGDPPPRAHIDSIGVTEAACDDAQPARFEIRASDGRAVSRPTIPADLAACAECLREIRDPVQRRHGYPFTNCTNCGPRWSIVHRLPYDRPQTSMAEFVMCPNCRAEYTDPTDRRFHAQPIACGRCGPTLCLLDESGSVTAAAEAALSAAVKVLLGGGIVAMKGLGGFQLLADATNADAVARLRERKRRPDRPLALMLPSLEAVQQCCEVSDEEARALTSCEAPILLLRRRCDHGENALQSAATAGSSSSSEQVAPGATANLCRRAGQGRGGHNAIAVSSSRPGQGRGPRNEKSCNDVVESVAPGNPCLGVMLPYTPLHHLLTAAVARPIVCTSGNLSEEPMAITTEDAVERLGGRHGSTDTHQSRPDKLTGAIADAILTHDRPIVRPVDDSIARVGPDGLQVLRRARGYAPLPIDLGAEGPVALAVGGHLKNTVALALGSQAILSPHVGDLESVLSLEVHRQAIRDLLEFFEVSPQVVACDLHPDYASTRGAEVLAAQWEVPLVRVQHHHAHVAACLAEHGLSGPALGLAWDGTGYGIDGTVWGGEALLCNTSGFSRVAHLRTFALPGGDRAVREPRRSALGLLFEIFGQRAAGHTADWFPAAQRNTLLDLLTRSLHCPRTSSMGRLFDAVAALCGLPAVVTYEGQAAMALQFAADETVRDVYPLPLSDDTPAVVDWEPLVRGVLADRRCGVPVGRISGRFHNALAEVALSTARQADCRDVVLTGGCFQNALLVDRVRSRLLDCGFRVYTHLRVPPNDGGIALGQLRVAVAKSKE